MKRWLWLFFGLFFLMGCEIVLPQHPYYNAHEIELLFPEASERWVYFYGDPMVVELEGQTLTLAPGKEPSPWAVPGALWVNGMPLWREVLPPVRPEVWAEYDPFARAFKVYARTDVRASWYYDGATWYRLTGPLAAGAEVVARPERRTFTGEKLTPDEAKVIRTELELRAKGRPLVVFEREKPVHPPYRFSPAPWIYLRSSFRVQDELPEVIILNQATWKVLDQGNYAAYRDKTPLAYLACSEEGVRQLWQLAYGNRLPAPTPPSPDGRCYAGFFWGLKPTGGYRVEVVSGRVEGGVAEFVLNLVSPPPGALTTQALTSPFVLIEIRGEVSEVRFLDPEGRLLARALAR